MFIQHKMRVITVLKLREQVMKAVLDSDNPEHFVNGIISLPNAQLNNLTKEEHFHFDLESVPLNGSLDDDDDA